MPWRKGGSPKIFALLALFVAGSALSIVTSLLPVEEVSALTQAQKDYCLANYPADKRISDQVTGAVNQDWIDNECGSSGMCTTRPVPGRVPYAVVVACDPNAVVRVTIETTAAITDAVKKGYGDLAAKELCGSDEICKAAMRGYVSVCIDEYIQNPPANAPDFPNINTDTLVNCMARDGKLDGSQRLKLIKVFKENAGEIATAANKAEEAAKKQACEDGGGTWVEDSSECGTKVVCTSSIQGIGWLVCPAINFMAEMSDWAYSFLASQFLSVNVDLVAGVRDSWAKFRDIANIAFVIALLIVIYSQVTSVGISNYGIKKMLPKIVVAAILVNISYDICRIAVDLSNILGYGIAKFFDNNFGFIEVAENNSALDSLGNGLFIAGAIGAAVAGVVGIAMAVSVPVVLSAILALGLMVLILLAREALIILLIAIAPLAFVAYLLPNTEQWYKKWVKLFSTLLLLFPIIGVVFGASKLAATILLNVGAARSASGEADVMTQVLAVGVMTVPFFVVPGLLKGALNAAGSVGAKLSGIADKAGKAATSAGEKNLKSRSQIYQTYQAGTKYRDQKRAAKLAKRRGTGLSSVVGRVSGGKGFNEKALNSASDLETAEFEEDVKSITNGYAPEDHKDIINTATSGKDKNGRAVSEAHRVAAIRYAAEQGGFGDVASIDTVGSGSQRILAAHQSALLKKGFKELGGSEVIADAGNGQMNKERLQQRVAENVNRGQLSEEQLVASDNATAFVADSALNAKDKSGNRVLTAKGHDNLRKAAKGARVNESTKGKINPFKENHFKSLGI